MSSGEATPCSISHRASRISAPWMRLPRKPITSFLTCTGRLPSERHDRADPSRRSSTSVWTERTTSTSGIRCAGMKKCRPIMRAWRLQALADLADREARGVRGERARRAGRASPSRRTASASARRSSVTVSTTMSIVGPRRLRPASHRSRALTYRSGLPMRGERALARAAGRPSRVAAERDTTSTFQPPARNMAMMPTPMVPPPDAPVAWRSLCGIFSSSQTRRTPRRRGNIAAHYITRGETS